MVELRLPGHGVLPAEVRVEVDRLHPKLFPVGSRGLRSKMIGDSEASKEDVGRGFGAASFYAFPVGEVEDVSRVDVGGGRTLEHPFLVSWRAQGRR